MKTLKKKKKLIASKVKSAQMNEQEIRKKVDLWFKKFPKCKDGDVVTWLEEVVAYSGTHPRSIADAPRYLKEGGVERSELTEQILNSAVTTTLPLAQEWARKQNADRSRSGWVGVLISGPDGWHDYKRPPDPRLAISKPATNSQQAAPAQSLPKSSSTPVVVQNTTNVPVVVTAGKKGGMRYTVYNYPVTHILRWMGFEAWTLEEINRCFGKLGIIAVDPNTIKAQWNAGKVGGDCMGRGPVPPLTTSQKQTLTQLSEESQPEKKGKVK